MWQGGGTPLPTPSGNQTSTTGNASQAVQNVGESASESANTILGLLAQWVPWWVAQLILTILVLLLTWYASKRIPQLLSRRMARRFQRPSVSRLILRSIRVGIIIIGVFFIIVGIYGVIKPGTFALSVTVFSAVVGVVIAPIVGSLISGLFVLTDRPYEVGDMIELADKNQRGFVEDITFSYTKIFTLDNTFLVIPNGSMRNRDVINYSAEDTRTRLHLDIGVTYESDIDEARKLIENAARTVDTVVKGGPAIRIGSARYPAAPTCFIDTFGGSSVQLRLRYWVKEPYKLLTVRSAVQEAVWERLDDADVEIAYPHTHVVFDDTSGQLSIAQSEATRNGERFPRTQPGTED